jgi:hypothetical protein
MNTISWEDGVGNRTKTKNDKRNKEKEGIETSRET